jgi:hypothetical protein
MNPPPAPKPIVRLLALALALATSACVSIVTPEQAPVAPAGKTTSPVGIAVTDHRTSTAGLRKDRYYGRVRLSYGIPTPIIDPKMATAERLTRQLEAGFRRQGAEVRSVVTEPFANAGAIVPGLAGNGARKVLLVRLNDMWIDFANPIGGRESILYFDATAQVLDPAGRVLATASRKFERNFRYNANDSFFNQAVWTLQPEFTALVNESAIRRALAP